MKRDNIQDWIARSLGVENYDDLEFRNHPQNGGIQYNKDKRFGHKKYDDRRGMQIQYEVKKDKKLEDSDKK